MWTGRPLRARSKSAGVIGVNEGSKTQAYPDLNVKDLAQAGFWTPFESFRPGVESTVKSLLMDAILALIAGLKSLPQEELDRLAGVVAEEPKRYRPIFLREMRTSLEMAGFINGYCIRFADLCDTRRQAVGRGGHPADMIAALLALCDCPGVMGKKALEAINLGYHMWAVIYNEMMYKRTDLDGTTALALTVPVMTSAVLGETPDKMQNALNLSAMGGPVAVEVRSSKIVTNAKCGATGYAIARAFWCHRMSSFLQATPTIFTGAKGWSKMVAPLDGGFAAYGDDAVYGQIQLKAFPCCNANQVATEGAVRIHAAVADQTDRIARIHIRVCEKDSRLAIRPGSPRYPTDHPSADHHIQFCTAVGLRYGALAPKHYEKEYLDDETIHRLIDKTEVSVLSDAEFERLGGEDGAGVLEVWMEDGTVWKEEIRRPCGLYTGLSTQERTLRMRETVNAKQAMIEQSYGYDLSEVAKIVYRFEQHSGKELIDAFAKILTD